MEKIINDVVVRGVKNIQKVNLREIKEYREFKDETGNYEKNTVYLLDTIGSNLLGILARDGIDVKKTFSNDIMEMNAVLGIEAARKCLFNEILDVMEFDDTYINHHHVHLLCDRMTTNEKLVSIFRHGINKDNIGPIAKASFEETTEMFLQAAKHGELDRMRGVSANIMCGQEGYYGTSSFQVYVDTNDLIQKYQNMNKDQENEEEEQEVEDTIDLSKDPRDILNELMKEQDSMVDKCSIQSLKMKNVLSDKMLDMGNHVIEEHDDDYELDI